MTNIDSTLPSNLQVVTQLHVELLQLNISQQLQQPVNTFHVSHCFWQHKQCIHRLLTHTLCTKSYTQKSLLSAKRCYTPMYINFNNMCNVSLHIVLLWHWFSGKRLILTDTTAVSRYWFNGVGASGLPYNFEIKGHILHVLTNKVTALSCIVPVCELWNSTICTTTQNATKWINAPYF